MQGSNEVPMKREQIFITVIGKDQKGIIARISNAVFAHNINIEDLNQKIMGGYFVMTMLADITDSPITITRLKKELSTIEDEMDLKIQVQHENIFKTMHRV
jgi:ACT domain-containing protein